jgi:hypothetical protein
MTPSRKRGVTPEITAQEAREQEVLRANRELAAYFKGDRTEREARAALKIIKAFVKARERTPAQSRLPLPGVHPAKGSKLPGSRTRTTTTRKAGRASVRRNLWKPISTTLETAADATATRDDEPSESGESSGSTGQPDE